MKFQQVLILVSFFTSYLGFCQQLIGPDICIIAPNSLVVGQTYTFSSNNNAQCTNCYDWDVSSGLQIVGVDTQSTVSIKILNNTSSTITLTYLNENGCNTCSQDINPAVIVCPTEDDFQLTPNTLYQNNGAYYSDATLIPDSNLDLSIIESIEWDIDYSSGSANIYPNGLSGSNFAAPHLTNPPDYSIDYELSDCPEVHDLYVLATVNFNNGCPSIQISRKVRIDFQCRQFQNANIITSIYPNPVEKDSLLHIEINESNLENINIKLINVYGEIVSDKRYLNNRSNSIFKEVFKISGNITKGLHFLEIYNGEMLLERKKILIK